jgi:integrase
MPRTKAGSLPSYRFHKSSGQAVVTLTDPSGRRHDVLLGVFNSPASRAEYLRVLGEWEARGRSLPTRTEGGAGDLTVAEVLLRFWTAHETTLYQDPDTGEETPEGSRVGQTIRALRELYAHTRAAEFGPLALKTVQAAMVKAGLARSEVNRRVGRVKRIFKWAVGEEIIPPSVHHALATVAGLNAKSGCRSTEKVKPVADDVIEKTLTTCNHPVAAMIRLQRLTGMRPGEVCRMTWSEIDTSGPVWVYQPGRHKNAWRGKDRVIAFGPKAQAILADFRHVEPEQPIFSPARLMKERWAEMRKKRKSKVQPSQITRAKVRPKRRWAIRYTPKSYRQAVVRASKRANVTAWFPYQIRHTAGTEVRKRFGLDGAQTLLGHEKADITQVYAMLAKDDVTRIAAEIG